MSQSAQSNPIACNLNDAQFQQRRELARRILLGDIQSVERLPLGLILTFRNTSTVEENVRTFIDLEKQCCGFLTFDMQPMANGVTVRVLGPNGSENTIDMFERIINEARQHEH